MTGVRKVLEIGYGIARSPKQTGVGLGTALNRAIPWVTAMEQDMRL